MPAPKEQLEALQDIKQMMERSSRFISLSGLSGIAAGICALVGAFFAFKVINPNGQHINVEQDGVRYEDVSELILKDYMGYRLFMIALFTFVAAFILAFIFTWLRSHKNSVPIWGLTARRLMINVSIPMLAGGVYLLKLIENGTYGLIAPGCLIFYGLALVNASKYTFGEIRYLGYAQIILGIVNCWFLGYGLYFWAAGFGVLHIIYGVIMWNKYERSKPLNGKGEY
jgi:hypothetical protein